MGFKCQFTGAIDWIRRGEEKVKKWREEEEKASFPSLDFCTTAEEKRKKKAQNGRKRKELNVKGQWSSKSDRRGKDTHIRAHEA